MADNRPDSLGGERRLQGDWAGGGTVEESYQPTEPQTHDSHQASRCAARVLSGLGEEYFFPQDQAAPTYFVHEGGGPIRGFIGPPEGI